ncbi:MAG: amidohydrolase family protein [Deltaproteobacteria bacterium]|nr:amidohydrolase family protein [Deltaproteobacteria bacterium]
MLLWLATGRLWAEEKREAPYLIDCELHYLDFNQSGDGMKVLFREMKDAGIRSAWVMGVPLQKVWGEHAPIRPLRYESDAGRVYYYSATDVILARDILSLPPEKRNRLHPFICGFNPTDRNAVEHIRLMLKLYPGFWDGIGEILTRHDILSHLTYGESARADHPALDPVYELAAENNLPVLLHSNITSPREPGFIYLGEVENALRKHPRTRIIWAHAGTSANIERRQHLSGLGQVIGRLLEQYPNLSIMLSWTLTSHYLFDKNGKPAASWLKLIRKHPDRFLVGSDVVGRFAKLGPAISAERLLLENLPPEIAVRVAHSNAERLLSLPRPAVTDIE